MKGSPAAIITRARIVRHLDRIDMWKSISRGTHIGALVTTAGYKLGMVSFIHEPEDWCLIWGMITVVDLGGRVLNSAYLKDLEDELVKRCEETGEELDLPIATKKYD